jgi:mannose-6-phosphate isomerase-like protein (cupin superfamily)
MNDVKVIAQRYADREKTDPKARIMRIADFIGENREKIHAGRIYVGDDFRAVVLTLVPGQGQELHMHPNTAHAWFIVSGSGVVTMEDGRTERVAPGQFCVHPRNTVHGIRNDRDENLVYIALSTGD